MITMIMMKFISWIVQMKFDIEDPWYTGNFDKVFDEISEAIDCIIKTW